MKLDEYFDRISYTPEAAAPNLKDLNALISAHVQSIPFENIDVLERRPISLDPDDLFRKMVLEKRGGYCLEQNGLFIHILNKLGYSASPLGARVRLPCKDRSEIPPRSHLSVMVELDGKKYMSDVGFGAFSLRAALIWEDGLEQETPYYRRRLVLEDERWFHQIWQMDHWKDLYELDGKVMYESDQEMANCYASTHPGSHFTRQLVISRLDADGGRLSLLDNELSIWSAEGELSSITIKEEDRPAVASRYFNMRWPSSA